MGPPSAPLCTLIVARVLATRGSRLPALRAPQMQMAPNSMMQPQIILLKEGTDTSQGKAQLISNINACQAVVDVVRTTLGPRGMDKLIHDDQGSVTISNDGATIMKLLQIVHPAAHTLVQAQPPPPTWPQPFPPRVLAPLTCIPSKLVAAAQAGVHSPCGCGALHVWVDAATRANGKVWTSCEPGPRTPRVADLHVARCRGG